MAPTRSPKLGHSGYSLVEVLLVVVIVIWALLDVIGPLLFGYPPFTVIKSAFRRRKKPGSSDPDTGKRVHSNKGKP